MSIISARERGDTLVEVLIAMSVLAIVTVSSFSLMNKGVAMMYDSMERSEVRFLLEKQIESLTYARDQYLREQVPGASLTVSAKAASTAWKDIKSVTSGGIPGVNECTNSTNAFSIQRDVAKNLKLVTVVTNATASGYPAPGNGIWIQKVASPLIVEVPYVDFYIRACWSQNSSSLTQVGTSVVRLYDN